jgi:hypothetical protein
MCAFITQAFGVSASALGAAMMNEHRLRDVLKTLISWLTLHKL